MSRKLGFIWFFFLGLFWLLIMLLSSSSARSQVIECDPDWTTVTVESSFTIDLVIDTADLSVFALQVEVAFDAGLVRLDAVDPGAWVSESGLQYFFYDYTEQPPGDAEAIRFDLAFLAGTVSGSGELAVCRFTALAPGESELDFVAVDVRGADNEILDFAHGEDDGITVQPGSPVADSSFGEVKLLY